MLFEKKSKEAAVIKAIGGSLMAIYGFYSATVAGPTMVQASSRDRDIVGKRLGLTIFTIALPMTYYGYTIAESGFNDLDEIAQYEN
jgi:hypothetical protein